MKYNDFKELKYNFQDVMNRTRVQLIKEAAPSSTYYKLLEICVQRIAVEFLQQHNIYNTTYESELIEYLLDDSDFFPNRFSRIIEKTYK